MIDTLYVHAGSHKTGTTSIQKFLRQNGKKLLSQGISRCDLKGRLKTSIDLSAYGPLFMNYEALNKMDVERVIVSKEVFSWADDIFTLEKFRDELREVARDVRIIFYLRRQDSLAISHKQEGTKWLDGSIAYGHDLSALPKTLSRSAHRYLDYEKKLDLWAQVFGQEKLIIRVFETEQLIAGDTVQDFCGILGIKSEDYQLPKRVNESLTRYSQLFLHQSRTQFKDSTREKKLLVKMVKLVDREAEDRAKLLPSRQQAVDFYQQFVDGNKRVNQRFKISPNEAIFNDDFSMYPQTVDEQGLTEQELYQMYARVLAHLTLKGKSKDKAEYTGVAHQLRDVALALPEECRQQTIELLQEALRLHPKGDFIRKKLLDLEDLEESCRYKGEIETVD